MSSPADTRPPNRGRFGNRRIGGFAGRLQQFIVVHVRPLSDNLGVPL